MKRARGLEKVRRNYGRQHELRANRRRTARELRCGIAGAAIIADELEDLVNADLPEQVFFRQLQAGEVAE